MAFWECQLQVNHPDLIFCMLVEVANAANLASIIDNDISILFDIDFSKRCQLPD